MPPASPPASGPTGRATIRRGRKRPACSAVSSGEELGLAGKVVDKATFDRLCDNRHPTEDRSLTPRTNDFRRVCKDLTFSRAEVVFHHRGVRRRGGTASACEKPSTTRWRRRWPRISSPTCSAGSDADGADYDITTGNALTAGFDHATSRPEDDDAIPDPHWHKHLLFLNATKRPDGRIVAGQFGNIVRDKAYYEAAFYARLAGKLEALGYVIDRRGGKEWEIAGVPQSAIDTFSKRTTQIEAEAERLGISDAAEQGGSWGPRSGPRSRRR